MKYKKRTISYIYFAFCFVMILFSCKSNRQEPMTPFEKTAFITLNFTKDSALKKTEVTLKNITVVDTKIRYILDESKTQEPYFLRILVSYNNGKFINAITEHPLYKRIDLYYESGKIESKSISLSQGEVTFRIPYFEKCKKITIKEIINFKEGKPIILKNEK